MRSLALRYEKYGKAHSASGSRWTAGGPGLSFWTGTVVGKTQRCENRNRHRTRLMDVAGNFMPGGVSRQRYRRRRAAVQGGRIQHIHNATNALRRGERD